MELPSELLDVHTGIKLVVPDPDTDPTPDAVIVRLVGDPDIDSPPDTFSVTSVPPELFNKAEVLVIELQVRLSISFVLLISLADIDRVFPASEVLNPPVLKLKNTSFPVLLVITH
jgi:hypothetical protein